MAEIIWPKTYTLAGFGCQGPFVLSHAGGALQAFRGHGARQQP